MTGYLFTIRHRAKEVVNDAMSANTVALIVAIVGVIGTLTASIIGQVLSARARRQELELQRLQRHDDYEREQQQNVLANKRNCYITMISAARRYRLELMSYLYAIDQGHIRANATRSLEDARLSFNVSISETQLTGTRSVLEALEPIRDGLAESYTATKNMEQEASESNESFEDIKTNLLTLWGEWPRLHAAMRNDLGVKD
jgi:hypothetical protein